MAFHDWQIDTDRHFHRPFLPEPAVAWVVSTFSAGPLELLRRSRERGLLAARNPPLPRARMFITILCRSRDGGRPKEGVKGVCHSAGNRLWEIMGHSIAEGLAKRFYPAFKRGQQMPWHVRSTDSTRRDATRRFTPRRRSPTRYDTTARRLRLGNLHFRDDRRALLSNNIAERTAGS